MYLRNTPCRSNAMVGCWTLHPRCENWGLSRQGFVHPRFKQVYSEQIITYMPHQPLTRLGRFSCGSDCRRA